MMIQLLLIGLLSVSGAAQAVQPVNPPRLPPTEIARPLPKLALPVPGAFAEKFQC